MPNRVEVAVGVYTEIPIELEVEGGEKLQAHIDAARREALANKATPLPTTPPKKPDDKSGTKAPPKGAGKE